MKKYCTFNMSQFLSQSQYTRMSPEKRIYKGTKNNEAKTVQFKYYIKPDTLWHGFQHSDQDSAPSGQKGEVQ